MRRLSVYQVITRPSADEQPAAREPWVCSTEQDRPCAAASIVASLDAIVTQVRALGVPVATEFPDNVELPVDARGFGGASLTRDN